MRLWPGCRRVCFAIVRNPARLPKRPEPSFGTGEQAMIGVGIIGYGYWGPNLVRNFSEVPGARVGGVSDLRPERLAEVQGRYPTIKTTTDFQELLADPEIHAVAIAT